MKKILVFENSGSGKSTLSKKLFVEYNLAHLDLDTLAFKINSSTQRRNIAESILAIHEFIEEHDAWIIEGGYTDLLEPLMSQASEIYFLNLSVEKCQENARNRAWEPHKYLLKETQDKNLGMLLE